MPNTRSSSRAGRGKNKKVTFEQELERANAELAPLLNQSKISKRILKARSKAEFNKLLDKERKKLRSEFKELLDAEVRDY